MVAGWLVRLFVGFFSVCLLMMMMMMSDGVTVLAVSFSLWSEGGGGS